VQRLNGVRAESAADLADRNVLGYLEDFDKGFWRAMRPHREAIEEDWERDGVKNEAPVMEVDSTNGVAQE